MPFLVAEFQLLNVETVIEIENQHLPNSTVIIILR